MDEETLFYRAQSKPQGERSAFLDQACGGDIALRRRMELLLHADDNPGSFLADAIAESEVTVDQEGRDSQRGFAIEASHNEGPGSQIGPYKLLQQIGEGGMGTVFMAAQMQPVQRKVALKIIRQG